MKKGVWIFADFFKHFYPLNNTSDKNDTSVHFEDSKNMVLNKVKYFDNEISNEIFIFARN